MHTPQSAKRFSTIEPRKAELPKKPREDQLLKLIQKRKQDRQRNPMGIDDSLLSFTQSNDFEVSFNKFQQVFGKLKVNKALHQQQQEQQKANNSELSGILNQCEDSRNFVLRTLDRVRTKQG